MIKDTSIYKNTIEKLSLVGGLLSSSSHLLPSVYMKEVVPVDRANTWPSRVRVCSICPDLSLVGETTIAKVFTWNPPQGHPTFKASNPPPRVTLPQLCDFSCKRFAAIYKEMYEKLSHPGLFGILY